jgi:hypothetical protein
MVGIRRVGLIRAMRPGEDAPLEVMQCCLVWVRRQQRSNGTGFLFFT